MAVQKIDWKKMVSESGGNRIFLPDGFKKAQEELEAKRKGFNEKAVDMAKEEIVMNVANQNLFLEIRKYLEKNGHPDIWVMQLGFDSAALKDGMFVLNITENRQ